MRSLLAIGSVLVVISGCAPSPYWTESQWTGPQGTGPQWTGPAPAGMPGQSLPVLYHNPALLPIADHRCAWETVVDVVDDYFRIEREEPVRLIGDILTAGRIDTFPTGGATIFEPWRSDCVGRHERLESTLQSIRRRAEVRVTPVAGGYEVDVVVLKELEDVLWPEHAATGAATFRYDGSLTRVVNPAFGQETNCGWIPQGRDTALEQRILSDLQARCGRLPVSTLPLVE